MKTKIKITAAIVAGQLATLVAGWIGHGIVDGWNDPSCPQEDSCYADYDGSDWTIHEGQRINWETVDLPHFPAND